MSDNKMTRERWFALPLPLRQRWWVETDWDRKPPSEELLADVERALLKKDDDNE